jgi:mannose-6-phosphate isomerase-like protein (cupin superfamily)
MQLAVQRLLPGERVAREMHPTHDQFLRVEQGQVMIVFSSGERLQLTADATDATIICAGTWHELVNRSSSVTARFYTVYGPPAHTVEEQHADDQEAV